MKVVCISIVERGGFNALTLNKVYNATGGTISDENGRTTLQVVDDTGKKRFYFWDRFRRLDDIRQDKLNEVLQ